MTAKTDLRARVGVAVLAMTAAAGALAAPILDPATQKFIDGLAGRKPIYTLSARAAREVLLSAQSGPVELPRVSMEDRVILVGPTGKTRVRIIRPEDAEGTLPVILYYHGAGWVMGDAKTHDRLVRELAGGVKATVVFVEYERSPEHRYPVATEQDYAVADYVSKHPKEFNVDASRMAIAGDGVGGNMAAVVSLLAKERHGPAIKAQLLFYPVTDAGMSVSPLNATPEQLRGLPPALVITADFVMLNALADTPAARAALDQATAFLRNALVPVSPWTRCAADSCNASDD